MNEFVYLGTRKMLYNTSVVLVCLEMMCLTQALSLADDFTIMSDIRNNRLIAHDFSAE